MFLDAITDHGKTLNRVPSFKSWLNGRPNATDAAAATRALASASNDGDGADPVRTITVPQ
jgi:hypothetical protein